MGQSFLFRYWLWLLQRQMCGQSGTLGKKEKKQHNPNDFSINSVDNQKKVRIIIFRMDTKKDAKIVKCGIMAEISRDKLVVGAKQLRKAFRDGRVNRVYLAQNADPSVTEPLEALCEEHSIICTWVRSMNELGRACGIEVGAAAAAVVD